MKNKRTARLIMIFAALLLLITCSISTQAATKNVCKINGKNYDSIEKAIKAVKNNQTIILTSGIVTNRMITIAKPNVKFRINLNLHTYHYTGEKYAFVVKSGNVIITHGTVKSDSSCFYIDRDGSMTTINGRYWGYTVNKGALTINGSVFDGDAGRDENYYNNDLIKNYGRLSILKGALSNRKSSCIWNYGGIVKIKGGKISSLYDDGCGIYNNKNGKVYVSGGTISAYGNAINNIASYVEINGGTLEARGWDYPTIYNKQGKLLLKGGKIIANNTAVHAIYNYNGNTLIKGGYFVGEIANKSSGNNKLKITNGTFECNFTSVLWNISGITEISGGDFSSKYSTLVNDRNGRLYVTNGYFISYSDYYCLWNHGKASLTGGSFGTVSGWRDAIFVVMGGEIYVSPNVVYTGEIVYN